ncbi:hypothetical protein RBB50_010149 [Rhinocladiella similis]
MAQPLLSSMCRTCRLSHLSSVPIRRGFATTVQRHAEGGGGSPLSPRRGFVVDRTEAEPESADKLFRDALRGVDQPQSPSSDTIIRNLARSARDEAATRPSARLHVDEPYHIHVYAHKHNMHITFTDPSHNPILSLSCGSIGLKHAQRATYDACFQLAAYTFRKMVEKQWRVGGKKMSHNPMQTLADIRRPGAQYGGAGIEIILRGFGPGRDAFQKALLGTEGRMIKPLVAKVTDSTRLKFGGTRSPNVRRL